MNVSLTLEQIIQEELSSIIAEQIALPNKRITATPTLSNVVDVNKFNAKNIAQQIYDAKGIFNDDETIAVKAMYKIKNIKQYKDVFTQFKKLSGVGLASYLKSFLSNKDLIKLAIYLYKILSPNDYKWTVKQLVSYDDLVAATIASRDDATRFEKFSFGGQLNREQALIVYDMIEDKNVYGDLHDKKREATKDPGLSTALIKPFVSTEYYVEHATWSSFINAPGGLRSMVYSPIGIGATTTLALIPTPWTKVPVAILFGILAIDDISRISEGNDWAWLDLLFDSIGIFSGAGGVKLMKPIAQKFASLIKWVKNGGILARMSRAMFNVFFEIISAISKTPLGRVLASGSKAVNAIQSAIRNGITKSLRFIKTTLIQLKNTMPDPIKRWAANALNALKSTSVEYYMQELKPMFDAMRLVARGVREFIKAPKTAVLELARILGIESKWVVPVATGAQTAWIANMFVELPNQLSWWATWYDEQLSKQESEQVKQELTNILTDGVTYYTFINKPNNNIKMYFPTDDGVWLSADYKIPVYNTKKAPGKKIPIYLILLEKKAGYAKITIPSAMRTSGERNTAWVKMSDITLAPKLKK